MKGLIINVYRDTSDDYDCTRNGISRQHSELTLVGEGIAEIFEVVPNRPAVKIVMRNLWNNQTKRREPYLHIEPVDEKYHAGKLLMFGGNFGWSFDNRFPSALPLKIHDCYEF